MVGLEQAPLTVVLALDVSNSVAGELLDALRNAGHALVEGLPPRDHVALLSFSHRVELLAPPGADRAAAHRALDLLKPRGATALNDAIYVAMRLRAPDERRAVVVFSDGGDNASWLSGAQVREMSLLTGTVVYAVSRRPPEPAASRRSDDVPPPEAGHRRELRTLAETTGGIFLEATEPAAIRSRFLRVLDDMSTRYVLAFVPTGVAPEGEHRLEVKVRRRGVSVRCRRGYVVPRKVRTYPSSPGPSPPAGPSSPGR